MYDFDEEELRNLLGLKLPEESFHAQQLPQELQQGLLGSTGEEEQNPQEKLPQGSQGSQAAAEMAQRAAQTTQAASNNALAQRQAETQQQAQQAVAQQQQAGAGLGGLLGRIAGAMFIPGGGLMGWLKKANGW